MKWTKERGSHLMFTIAYEYRTQDIPTFFPSDPSHGQA